MNDQSDSADRSPSTDEAAGMAWWNGLDEEGRRFWLYLTSSGVVADAWAVHKRAQIDPANYHNINFWNDRLAELHQVTASAPNDARALADLESVESLLAIEASEKSLPMRAWRIGDDHVVVARSAEQALAVSYAEGLEMSGGGWLDLNIIAAIDNPQDCRPIKFEEEAEVMALDVMLKRFVIPRHIWTSWWAD